VEALQAQGDLRQLPTEAGVVAFENAAWTVADSSSATSVVPIVRTGGGTPSWLRELGVGGGLLVVVLGVAEGVVRRRRRRRLTRTTGARPGEAPPADEGPSGGGEPPSREAGLDEATAVGSPAAEPEPSAI
jgi:hypothetical protein